MKKIIRLTESDLLRIIKRVISEQETQQTISGEESELIGLLKSKGFKLYTDSAAASRDIARVDLTPAVWYYGNPKEKAYCYKTRETNYDGVNYKDEITCSRSTILVKNKNYFAENSIFNGSPKLTGSTNVSMPIYKFKFPLEGGDVSTYENAKNAYLTNLIPIDVLQQVDEETLNREIEGIKTYLPQPYRKELVLLAQNAINQSREQAKDFPLDKQKVFNDRIDALVQYGKSAGYTALK